MYSNSPLKSLLSYSSCFHLLYTLAFLQLCNIHILLPSTGQWARLSVCSWFSYSFSTLLKCPSLHAKFKSVLQLCPQVIPFHNTWSFCALEEFIKSSFVSLFVSCPSRSMSLPASWGHSLAALTGTCCQYMVVPYLPRGTMGHWS